jgi:hypothetical protein
MQASSDQDVCSALNAFANRLHPGALQELVPLWRDLRDHAPGNLRDVIAERLSRPEYSRFVVPGGPVHAPGSVKAIAAEMQAAKGQGAGGAFGTRGVGLEVLPTIPAPPRPAGPTMTEILIKKMESASFSKLHSTGISAQIRRNRGFRSF